MMEINPAIDPKNQLLIGLEELYNEPFFSQLRFALDQNSTRRRLYDVLTAVASVCKDQSAFLTKLREALDRPTDREFWLWICRAFETQGDDGLFIESLKNLAHDSSDFDFNINLLQLLSHAGPVKAEFFFNLKRVLEHKDKEYCTEALRLLEQDVENTPALISRIRKSIEAKDSLSSCAHLLRGFREFPEWNWCHRILRTLDKFPESFRWDCLSRSQLQSKNWLIQETINCFGTDLQNVHIMCGWYGILGTLMHLSGRFPHLKVRSFDNDESCYEIARELNRDWVMDDWKFQPFTANIFELDYGRGPEDGIVIPHPSHFYRETSSLIVNSSCEHISPLSEWLDLIPKGTPLALQSNDGFQFDDHINCSKSLEEFKLQVSLGKVLFEGTLPCDQFNRFMIIGYR